MRILKRSVGWRRMGGVKPEEAIDRMRALRAEAATLPHSTSSAEFNSWKPRVRSLLTRALGEHHHITERFVNTKWTPSMYTLGDTSAFSDVPRDNPRGAGHPRCRHC